MNFEIVSYLLDWLPSLVVFLVGFVSVFLTGKRFSRLDSLVSALCVPQAVEKSVEQSVDLVEKSVEQSVDLVEKPVEQHYAPLDLSDEYILISCNYFFDLAEKRGLLNGRK